jgi:hypothetical protein
MQRLLTVFTGLLTVLLLTGCSIFSKKPAELPPLPEPATNAPLSVAEKDLDKATQDRLSKVAASVGISYVLAQRPQDEKTNLVLQNELKLAKTLTGKADEIDWALTRKRVEAVLGGMPVADAYKKEQEEATALKKKLSDADAKYEAEKAKKQAEFNAKILEREQLLAQEKALRAQEAEEARKDKFLYMGGLICLAGVACIVFGPKLIGLQLLGAGVAVSSIPTIWSSPYFIYVAGVFALLAVIAVARVVFRKKPVACVPVPNEAEPQPEDPK